MKRNIQIFKKIYFFSKNRIPKIHHFDIFDNFVSFIIKFRKNAKKLNFKKFKINNSSLLNLPIKCIYVYIYVFYIRLKLNHFCCTNDIVAFTCWNKILRSSKWNLYENLEFFNNPVTLSDIAYSPRAPVFHHLIPNYTLVPSTENIERQACQFSSQIRRENN